MVGEEGLKPQKQERCLARSLIYLTLLSCSGKTQRPSWFSSSWNEISSQEGRARPDPCCCWRNNTFRFGWGYFIHSTRHHHHRLVVPKSLHLQLIQEAHSGAFTGHFAPMVRRFTSLYIYTVHTIYLCGTFLCANAQDSSPHEGGW